MKPQLIPIKDFPTMVSPVDTADFKQLTSFLERDLIQRIRVINKAYSEDDIETIVSKDLHDNGLGDYIDDMLPELCLFLSQLAQGDIGQSMFILRNVLLKGNAAHFALEQHQQSMPWQEGRISDSDDWEQMDQAQRIRGMG